MMNLAALIHGVREFDSNEIDEKDFHHSNQRPQMKTQMVRLVLICYSIRVEWNAITPHHDIATSCQLIEENSILADLQFYCKDRKIKRMSIASKQRRTPSSSYCNLCLPKNSEQ
jgi:hypothetical protein